MRKLANSMIAGGSDWRTMAGNSKPCFRRNSQIFARHYRRARINVYECFSLMTKETAAASGSRRFCIKHCGKYLIYRGIQRFISNCKQTHRAQTRLLAVGSSIEPRRGRPGRDRSGTGAGSATTSRWRITQARARELAA